jgi:hypothetical protein
MSDLLAAFETFKNEPEQLTSAQIALIAKADPALAARARHSQRDAVMASAIVTFVKAALDQRLAPVEAENADLKARVLELEAQAAAARVLDVR